MNNIFDIVYNKLVRLMVGPRLRGAKQIAWLRALCSPINTVYQTFRRNRDANLYRLKITGQVIYLERLLNDRYDLSSRRIRIVDALTYDPLYLYTEDENKPVAFYTEGEQHPAYLFTEEETGLEAVDFWVLIPGTIMFNDTELRAVVDSYRLPSKTYKIQRV